MRRVISIIVAAEQQ